MRNRFLNTIRSQITPQAGEIHELQAYREAILRVLTILLSIVGIPMMFLNGRAFVENGNYIFLGFGIFTLTFLTLSAIFEKRVPFILRSSVLVILAYGFFVLALDNYGLVGDARSWLVFFTIITTLMFGLRWGILANVIGMTTYDIYGYLLLNKLTTPKVLLGMDYNLSSEVWITAGVTLTFISLLLTISIGLLIRNMEQGRITLQQSYEETQQISQQLQDEQEILKERSGNLERRLIQIRTAAEISRSLGTILDPTELITTVAELIQNRFNLYYVGVFLNDNFNRYAVLEAGTGEAGKTMLEEHHRLSIGGSSMVGWATSHNQPRISMNVEQESVRFKNPHLPLTRSELAIPISIGKQVLGAISVQSVEADAFDDDDITIIQSIGDSLAIALENARLFQQFENSLAEIQQLNRQYMSDSWQQILLNTEDQELAAEAGIVSRDEDALTEISIPLTLRGDQVIGNISLETGQRELSTEDKDFIRAVSDQTALALESARLLDEANKRVEQQLAIQELTTQFSRSLDFEGLLQSIVQELGSLPSIKEASIHISPSDHTEEQTSPPEEVN